MYSDKYKKVLAFSHLAQFIKENGFSVSDLIRDIVPEYDENLVLEVEEREFVDMSDEEFLEKSKHYLAELYQEIVS